MQFRKKPVVIEAIEWTGFHTDYDEIKKLDSNNTVQPLTRDGRLYIDTLEGTHEAQIGDYIIRGVKGELYPCKPDIFEMTYEPVDDSPHPGRLTEKESI